MYLENSFKIEEILGDKALEFKCKFYGMEFKKNTEKTKSIGNCIGTSLKKIEKIINGKPITETKELEKNMGIDG